MDILVEISKVDLQVDTIST